MATDREVGELDGGVADACLAGGDIPVPGAEPSDEALILNLRLRGLTAAADRLERYAGLATEQRHLSDAARDQGLAWATGMAFEGIPLTELTCDDAVALAAIMAVRAKQTQAEEAMPRLSLPSGVR